MKQYDEVVQACREIFLQKSADYGTSWRVLRPVSLADQIMIKALRIRQIQETGTQKIQDGVDGEFRGIYNYAIIALVQEGLPADEQWDLPLAEAEKGYDASAAAVRRLMQDKNHDYGEAWRQMSQPSFVDLILAKLQRVRKILDQGGRTQVSEGIGANFADIANYAVFALIRLREAPDGFRSGLRPEKASP